MVYKKLDGFFRKKIGSELVEKKLEAEIKKLINMPRYVKTSIRKDDDVVIIIILIMYNKNKILERYCTGFKLDNKIIKEKILVF